MIKTRLARRMLSIALFPVLSLAVHADPPTTPPSSPPAAPAQPAPIEIDPTIKEGVDAAMNKLVVIRGTIATAEWSATGKVMKIEFKGNDQSKLLAVAFSTIKPALDQKFGGNAAEHLVGKAVVITGILVPYVSKTAGGATRPEVVLKSVDQIEVVETK